MVADLQWGNLTNYQPENVFILSFSYISYCPFTLNPILVPFLLSMLCPLGLV